MANKTKKDFYNEIKAILEQAEATDLVAFCDHEIEMLSKRTKASGKLTPDQQKNAALMDVIETVLTENDRPMTIKELMADERLSEIKSNQHANSLLIAMRRAGTVKSIKDKNGTSFALGLDEKYFPADSE